MSPARRQVPKWGSRREDLPERVVVRWPGGPHDFELEPQPFTAWLKPDRKPGWYLVTGWVVKPEGAEHRTMRSFYAERVGPTEFVMIPMIRKGAP